MYKTRLSTLQKVITCCIMLLLAVFSILPTIHLSTKEILFFRFDQIFHFFIYFTLTFFYLYVFGVWRCSVKAAYKIFFYILPVFFAITLEAVQLYIPTRSFDISDLSSNLLGVFLAFIIYFVVKVYKKWKSKKTENQLLINIEGLDAG